MQFDQTGRRLWRSIALVAVLSLCLVVTTVALVYSMVAVEGNFFHTGIVDINLNDGKPVIEEHEFLFEPGMTVKKDFFVQNNGTCDVYYRLYFQQVSGGLADVLTVRVCDGDRVLLEDTVSHFQRGQVQALDDVLRIGEKRNLQLWFYFPADCGNEVQGQYLTFDFSADAVQIKNNPQKEFDG